MQVKKFEVEVGKQKVSCELAIPDGEHVKGNLVIILAHGLNGKRGMNDPVVSAMHELLCRRGFVTLRFNFLFAQKNNKRRDSDEILAKTYSKVVTHLRKMHPASIIFGGFSLGSLVAADIAKTLHADGLLLLGYPLKDQKGNNVVSKISSSTPVLFCSGSEDRFTDPKDLSHLVQGLKNNDVSVEMFYIQGAGHSFRPRDTSLFTWRAIFLEMVEMIDRWISHHWY